MDRLWTAQTTRPSDDEDTTGEKAETREVVLYEKLVTPSPVKFKDPGWGMCIGLASRKRLP